VALPFDECELGEGGMIFRLRNDTQTSKLQHWCGFPSTFVPKAAPVLEFHFNFLICHFDRREKSASASLWKKQVSHPIKPGSKLQVRGLGWLHQPNNSNRCGPCEFMRYLMLGWYS
jgi:hypothetical protein